MTRKNQGQSDDPRSASETMDRRKLRGLILLMVAINLVLCAFMIAFCLGMARWTTLSASTWLVVATFWYLAVGYFRLFAGGVAVPRAFSFCVVGSIVLALAGRGGETFGWLNDTAGFGVIAAGLGSAFAAVSISFLARKLPELFNNE